MATKQTSPKAPKSLAKVIPFILVIGGAIGLASSFIITWDKMKLLENPRFQPNCDLNPIISCGSVMSSQQGSAFGFPNPWIGLAAFAVMITIGVGIWAGAKFKKWFWLGLNLGAFLGLLFVHWLFYQSVYNIGALCPYCMAVWVVVITTFWYTTLYNFEQKYLYLSLPKRFAAVPGWLRRHHVDILVLWVLIIAGLILKHFWYYYGSHL